jgi:hypothetical protein
MPTTTRWSLSDGARDGCATTRRCPGERWNELFGALRSNRDRAILALAVSNGARASELLGVRGVDLDWGDQLMRVVRKGTLAEQWLPAIPEAFVWTRLCLAEGPPTDPQAPLWWTLRRRDHGEGLAYQSMNYEALRAVLYWLWVRIGCGCRARDDSAEAEHLGWATDQLSGPRSERCDRAQG